MTSCRSCRRPSQRMATASPRPSPTWRSAQTGPMFRPPSGAPVSSVCASLQWNAVSSHAPAIPADAVAAMVLPGLAETMRPPRRYLVRRPLETIPRPKAPAPGVGRHSVRPDRPVQQKELQGTDAPWRYFMLRNCRGAILDPGL
ncbi:hypothetical protein amb1421 [Paramagnetospirillum magneticum AMB-1]|uniref:Uncharacterized protein n=1 Tax=Paramagnetospirillum magneticum (strain ATCC 700264 / AMB-1) TaxID=342108 RepID=Q2W7F0_PARM1|nr:hypothetical protein amb1421 [Paramagnetospirillum magneticum AMB-1]